MSQTERALERLRAARRRIVTLAAEWQAAGLDTEALSLPLIEIQEAIAELEAMDLEGARAAALVVLGRSLRNHFNAVRVSGAGLETEDNPERRRRWLDLLEEAANGCITTLDRMRPLMPDE